MINFVSFKCPVCHEPLGIEGRTYACTNNHSYDLARQGYLNLLLAQQRRSKQPGDSDEMVLSRQRFLNQGYYQGLASVIAEMIGSRPDGFAHSLLDLGCGEGYYLQQLRAAAETRGQSEYLQIAGVDISKRAVREAAKRQLDLQLAVASTAALPFFDQSFDSLLCVFSPLSASEALRMLKPGGQVILVGPGENHLQGLMAEIYDELIPHSGNYAVLDQASGLVLSDQREFQQTIEVRDSAIFDLLSMTPYYWQCSPEQQQRLAQLLSLSTPIHFYLQRYTKAEA